MLEDRYFAFSFAIEQMAKNLQKLKSEKMGQFGLRAVHVTFLVKLGRATGGLTGAELATCCGIDKSLVSRIVEELLRGNYVAYEAGERRYRRKILLTDLGRRLLDEIRTMIDESVKAVRADISDEDLEAFYRVITTMDQNVDQLLEAN